MCPRTPGARYALSCPCADCYAGKVQHRAKTAKNLRRYPPRDLPPILSDCPNVVRGRTHALSCTCDLCYGARARISMEANASRRDQEIDEVVVHRMITDPVLTVTPTMVERRAAAIELRRRGKGANAIAEKIGVHPGTVQRYFHEAGLTVPKLRGPELRKIVKDRILEDPILSFRELSKETGALPTTLSMHHAALVASGELPARDNLRTRNPRNGRR